MIELTQNCDNQISVLVKKKNIRKASLKNHQISGILNNFLKIING